MMSFPRFLAALFVGLIWASGAYAACTGGTCWWILGSATMDGTSDNGHWSTAGSGGVSCGCVPNLTTDALTFDANSGGGTVTVNETVQTSTLTFTGYTGTFNDSTNNKAITITTAFVDTSGTHTIQMGSNTWSVTATSGTVWNIANAGLTLTAGTSTLAFSGTGTANRTIIFGGKTYNTVSMATGARQFSYTLTTTGATMATWGVTAPIWIQVAVGLTMTVTGTGGFAWSGSAGNEIFLQSNAAGSTANIHLNTASGNSMSWAAVKDMLVNTSSINCTTCFDLGGNAGSTMTINAPVLGNITGSSMLGGGP